jgi:hypothetical protein
MGPVTGLGGDQMFGVVVLVPGCRTPEDAKALVEEFLPHNRMAVAEKYFALGNPATDSKDTP